MKSPVKGAIALLVILAGSLHAELKLNPLFTDHAVLQADLSVPVWGTATAGETVIVEFAGQKKEAQVDSDGNWMVILDTLITNAEPAAMTVTSGAESATVSDILVGEVWVCSGQSNMGWSVGNTDDKDLVIKEAEEGKYKDIRLFKVPVTGADEPQTTVNASWQTCDAQNTQAFTAAGFYFGRKLQPELGVPVGLIQSANGGTNAYSWINNDTYNNDPVAGPSRDHFAAAVEAYPAASKRFEEQMAAWKEKVKVEGKDAAGRPPREPLGPNHVKRPTGHYNAMIAPLEPYAFRGAIWYQGEANSRPPFADQYKDLLNALVEDWRADWAGASGLERRDFPFIAVQLPNYAGGHAWGWPIIREQFLKFWQEGTNTGMAVSIDVGDPKDIHPTNKLPVGERLATFALGTTYEKEIEYSGPIYKSSMFGNGEATITFDHVGSGLKTLDGKPPRHFTIAGEDGTFYEAQAEIDGNSVIVSSEMVKEPTMVRYAWLNNPEGANLANQEGLPASPFRTDTDPIPAPES